MNKKVKWSVISISTISALTFGSLVMNNEKTATNEALAKGKDVFREKLASFNLEDGFERHGEDDDYEEHDDDYEEDDGDYEGHDEDREDARDDHENQERGTSWSQDQIVNVPDGGFQQDQGSSRTSR
jgi:hypothetical protein